MTANGSNQYPDYRIAFDGVMTYTVVHKPSGENISHHESLSEARAAARRYTAADRRRQTNSISTGG